MEISVVNQSKMPTADFAFAVRACQIQMQHHFAPAWQWDLSDGSALWPVVGYDSFAGLQPGQHHPITVRDDIYRPGTGGFHGSAFGATYGRVQYDGDWTSVIMSHETLEMRVDPTCSLWRPYGIEGGRRVALEICDPVQDDTYDIDVTVLGVTRRMKVCNFVLPSWFDPQSRGPWDFLALCKRPQENRGYLAVEERDGSRSFVFAARTKLEERASYAGKLKDPLSRTYRRFENG